MEKIKIFDQCADIVVSVEALFSLARVRYLRPDLVSQYIAALVSKSKRARAAALRNGALHDIFHMARIGGVPACESGSVVKTDGASVL